jgi:VCBS repeat-containing protein
VPCGSTKAIVEKDNNGAYQAGDLLRMEVDPADNKLHYFRNDVEFYVSTVTLTAANFPLLVDLAMESIGGEITVPRINLPQPLPPVAVADAFTIAEDTVAMGNVLTNDSDPEGQAITAALDDNVASGSLTFLADGSFTYTPNADFNGSDSFTYHSSDGGLSSPVTTVSITVTAVNDPPVAFDDAYATLEDTQLSVAAATGVSLPNDMDADADSLTVTLLSGVSKGILSLASDGSFVYDPAPNQPLSGNEIISFSYTLSDGVASPTATARITVTAVNDPPMLLPPNYYVYTQPGQPVQLERPVVSVLDPDGDGSSATFVHGDSANPRVTISNGGTTVTYNPAVFIGLDTVELKARDTANVNSPNAYITVMVAPPGGEEEEVQTNQIAAYDRFGFRAAMSGTWALIGADRNDSYGDNAGKVFVYQQNAQNVWVQQGELYPVLAP